MVARRAIEAELNCTVDRYRCRVARYLTTRYQGCRVQTGIRKMVIRSESFLRFPIDYRPSMPCAKPKYRYVPIAGSLNRF